jgi:hypothetical protein
VRRLDDFNLSPAFVKIDVEGFEDHVLRGFSRTLATNPPQTILFEQNDANSASIPLLKDAGYKIHGVAKTLLKLTLVPVDEWSSDFHDYVATTAS